jgi:hypothetical protein
LTANLLTDVLADGHSTVRFFMLMAGVMAAVYLAVATQMEKKKPRPID